MKRIIIIMTVCLSNCSLFSQWKIGKNVKSINPNASFEVEDSSRGTLLTRVKLTNRFSPSPLSQFVQGMILYNTNISGSGNNAVTPGYYYSDGMQWIRMSSSSDVIQARNGLRKTLVGDTVILGGFLDRVTTIGTSATNTLAIMGLTSGKKTDSLMVLDSGTNRLKKISTDMLTRKGVVIFSDNQIVNDLDDVYIYQGTGGHILTLPMPSATNKGRVISLNNYAPSEYVCLTITPQIAVAGYGLSYSNLCSTILWSGESLGSEVGNSLKIVSDGTKWLKINY